MGRQVRGEKMALSRAGHGGYRHALLAFLLLLLPPNAWAISAGDEAPTSAVRRTMTELLYVLTELKDASRLAQRQWEVEQVVRRSFNYEVMAERSLGEAWGGLSAVERRQYVRVFLQLLRDEVTDTFREYSTAQVEYLSERSDGATAEVATAPAGSNIDSRIEFRMVRRSGGWVMDDLIREGISIVTNYHTQFSRILREGSFSDLMEHMRQKALVAKITEKADS